MFAMSFISSACSVMLSPTDFDIKLAFQNSNALVNDCANQASPIHVLQ